LTNLIQYSSGHTGGGSQAKSIAVTGGFESAFTSSHKLERNLHKDDSLLNLGMSLIAVGCYSIPGQVDKQ